MELMTHTKRTAQEILAERRANVLEAMRETDPVAKECILAQVALLDIELASLEEEV